MAQQFVSLVTEGGTPVRLANSRGVPYPTTGYGEIVFGREATLYYPTLIGAIYDSAAGFQMGTVAAPPIFFAGDTDTGIYSPAVGQVGITVNGVEGFRVEPGGDAFVIGDLEVAGSITGGSWAGTTVPPNKGGTGITSYTTGDLIVAGGATTLGRLADIASGNVLLSGGIGLSPAWGKVGLATHVSGNLPVTNLDGGTGANSTTYWCGDGTWTIPAFSLAIGTSPISGGASGRVLYNNAGILGAYTITGATSVVMSFQPTIENPTITSGMTFGGSAVSASVSGTGGLLLANNPVISGRLTYGGIQLTAAVTGSGKMVLDNGPTLISPTINGTPVLASPLARGSGGTGATSISGGLDAEMSSLEGAILYRSGVSWAALPPGSAGQVLESGGAGANPFWATPAGGGTVTVTGTPVSGQLTGWTSANSIRGLTLGTGLQMSGTTLNVDVENQDTTPPSIHTLDSGTSFAWPAGSVWARVRAVGGGGGGGIGAGAGGNTTVAGVVAVGGGAGAGVAAGGSNIAAVGGAGGTGGSGTAALRIDGDAGGASFGDGLAVTMAGSGGASKLGAGGTGDGSPGTAGGGGGGDDASGGTSSGGGGGEYIELIVSPLTGSLSYTLGAAGTGAGAGGAGRVVVEVHYNF